MNRRALWRISVTTSALGEEVVGDLLARTFNQPASSYTDVCSGKTQVSVYLSKRPLWTRRERKGLEAELGRLSGLGVLVGRASLVKVPWENWAESWKRHFRPMEIGKALLIQPSWIRRRPRPGQAVVTLDPGLSFGTGQHPTTAFCLHELVARRNRGRKQSFLDLGTGSGILAIAAAKLGYEPITAVDLDEEALRVARENGRKNAVARQVRFLRQDIRALRMPNSRGQAVVCANLTADLLIGQRERVLSCVEPGGALVLAGILKKEFGLVQAAYERAGLRLVASRTGKEWRSGTFVRNSGRHTQARSESADERAFERANRLKEQGKLAQAEALYRKSLRLRRELHGPSHAAVAQSMNWLANMLQQQGRYAEAEPLYRESLEMRKRVLGKEHQDVASSMSNLANLLQNTGSYREAESLYLCSLRLRKKAYGPRHQNVAMCMSNLALYRQRRGKYSQAEALFKKALEILDGSVGPQHRLSAYTKANFSDFLLWRGRAAEALALAKQAVAALRRLPAGHPYAQWAREVLTRAKAAREAPGLSARSAEK